MSLSASFSGAEPNGKPRHKDVGSSSRVTSVDRWLIRRALKQLGDPAIAVVLWNGEALGESEEPQVKVQISSRRGLIRLLGDLNLGFGEAYSQGEIEVDGELVELCDAIAEAQQSKRQTIPPKNRALQRKLKIARRNIHQHYDIGNEFYKLWLDDQLVYTCAYYEHPDVSLEEAQIAKLDHVCKKLRLRPNQQVIEAGCGWGALAMHMARHYNVNVRAYNISHEQIAYARQRAKAEGLTSRVEFVEDDWRNISGLCDAFVSVGMLEHVGVENFQLLGEKIRGCLKPNGMGLIHTIGRNAAKPLNRWTQERIFPGANPPSLRQMMDIFEQADFSILDVENLRLHYARTLEDWLLRFDEHKAEVREMFNEQFVRMWRLYLAGSISAFKNSTLQLFQVVFSWATNNELPWTRGHLYTKNGSAQSVVSADSFSNEATTDA